MGFQCFLFTSDEGIAGTIRLVLAGLDVEGEFCSEAVSAAERIANQAFQVVIIDWDKQPEAGLLLTTARQRKASERPITLAIVSDDASVPKALQAGANSILRKPIVVNQARDTLMTARDLLRAKREPAPPTPAKQAAAAEDSLSTLRANMEHGKEKTLRAGEFLQSAPATPGGSFETESDLSASMHEATPEPVDPLRELEPVAASVAERKPAEPPLPEPRDEPRGLEWHLKQRGINRQPLIVPNSSASAAAAAPAPEKTELLGFDQTPSKSASSVSSDHEASVASTPAGHSSIAEQKKEAELFAYMEGDSPEGKEKATLSFRLSKRTIGIAAVLAICAISAAPRMPWHPKMQLLWGKGQRAVHTWLYPQPMTPAQAPASHENFARAGDEYKLPAAEAIPDATTDPSQIQVVPVVDPTKKPTGDAENQAGTQPDGTTVTPADQAQTPTVQAPEAQASQTASGLQQSEPPLSPMATPAPGPAPATSMPVTVHPDAAAQVPLPATSTAVPAKKQPVAAPFSSGNIPSSLKSQLASSTPDLSGSRSPDTAMPSIEPVVVAESAERALLTEQLAIAYPSNIKNQQGTVFLQVLVGRDGTVQDAKFLQGSLAFARAAIDGVKQWKFRPYLMNGRTVSVQTLLTLTFKPAP